ncbi:MAG: type II toxin-antitoxin system ParD family antitoxin [Hyphomonas sp.]
MTVRMTISLPDGLAEMVERLVAEGRYASHSDVIRDGLRALEERRAAHEEKLALLRADLQARLEGEFISHEEMSRRVEHMLADKNRRRETKSA